MALGAKKAKLKIEYMKVEDLIPYKNNSRVHSPEQIDELVASMDEFGFYNPILVKGQTICAGHGRLMAATQREDKEVPVIRLDYLTEKQVRKLVIADNNLPLNASWDMESLRHEIGSMLEDDENIDVLGFDDNFLEALMSEDEETEPELKDKDLNEVYNIVIECKDEMDQLNAYESLKKLGYKCELKSS